MMNTNNVHPIRNSMEKSNKSHELVLPYIADVVAQTNETNFTKEAKLHSKNEGLIEKLNVVTDECKSAASEAKSHEREWQKHNHIEHNAFVGNIVFCLISLGVFAGEWIMGSLNLRGLNLDETETYIASFAISGAGFLASKAIATTFRELPFVLIENQKRMAKGMIIANVLFLLLMLLGMSLARSAAADATVEASEGTVLSLTALFGLGLLQFALYAMQVATFYVFLPANPVAERARVAFLKSKKRLTKLLAKRAKTAQILDSNVNNFYAECDAEIENGKRLIARYIGAIHSLGKSDLLSGFDLSIKDEWFLPPSNRVAKAVDLQPTTFHELLDVEDVKSPNQKQDEPIETNLTGA